MNNHLFRIAAAAALLSLSLVLISCRAVKPGNATHLEQINIDKSNNYYVIFKDRIAQERESASFQNEDEFFD